MPFDHERLTVYQRALDFAVIANQVVSTLPRGRGHLADQLSRASTSIVLNIAEGAGKYSGPDKRRYYLSAGGSTAECAAVLDILRRFGLVEDGVVVEGKGLLQEVGAMLTGLAKRHQRGGKG